jgi:hypothetical protein
MFDVDDETTAKRIWDKLGDIYVIKSNIQPNLFVEKSVQSN